MAYRREHVLVSIAILVFATFSVTPAYAASIYFSPSSLSRNARETFSAIIRVNTNAQAINAAQGSIVFDPAKIEVVSISKAGSIFNLWTQEPAFSNSEGTLQFEGGVPNPGYTGTSGLILTVSFRTKTATTLRGSTDVTLVSGAVLANDGLGTNIVSSLGKLTVTIVPNTVAPTEDEQPESAISTGDPQVTSSTHADPAKWYKNKAPQFSWTLPANATGTSYLITDKEASNPGPNSDGLNTSATFSDIADGTHYFHLKFRQNGAWGPIAHYKFNVDTVPPVDFDIRTVTIDDIHPEIAFETSDALAGVDHYEIKIGDHGWESLSSDQIGKPYRLSFDRIGTQPVSVKAIDKAGNETVKSISVTVSGSDVGSSALAWAVKLFNSIVNLLSANGLALALIAALVGVLMLIYEFLWAMLHRTWNHFQNDRVITKAESHVDDTLERILDDIKEEISFLNTISKRRPLGTEEKYLKTKLQQYAKALKNNKR